MKVLITGSTKGIGLEIANYFFKKGAKVLLNSRNKKQLISINKKIKNSSIYPFDVENQKITEKNLGYIFKKEKKIDTIICNVGSGSLVNNNQIGSDFFNKVFKKNFMSTFNIVEFLRKNKKFRNIQIICISSICGVERIDGAPVYYSVAKSALNVYVKMVSNLIVESNCRINLVIPGNILFKNSTWEKKLKKSKLKTLNYINKHVSTKQFGKPENISSLCWFLSKKSNSYINGSSFIVDGGQVKSF